MLNILYIAIFSIIISLSSPSFAQESGDLFMDSLMQTNAAGYAPLPEGTDIEGLKTSALATGDVKQMYSLGMAYQTGNIVDVDFTQAREWFLAAAEKGDSDAMVELARIYSMDSAITGLDKNQDEALKWIRLAERTKNPRAYYTLGNMYEDGFPVDKSYETAFKYYQKAALEGVLNAYIKVYLAYQYGKGVNPSLRKAVMWLRRIKDDSTNPDIKNYAQQILGDIYFELALRETNAAIKLNLFRLSWDNGNKYAVDALGDLFQAGVGIKQNFTKAVEYYQIAIDKFESIYAMERLGFIYLKGPAEITRDYGKALELFKKSADRGAVQSAYMIGYMNYYGMGIKANPEEAKKWFARSEELSKRNIKATVEANKRRDIRQSANAQASSQAIKEIIANTVQKDRDLERQQQMEEKIRKNRGLETPMSPDQMDVRQY